MTRYLGEAFEFYDAVKRTKRKVQVGSQITSCGNFAKAAELIAQGKMGPLVLAQGSYMRNNPKGEWNYRLQDWATGDSVDHRGRQIGWLREDMKQMGFNPDHYFRWRKYLPYCAGLLGDLVPHRLFPLMRATGNAEFPSRVVCLGTRKITPDRDVSDNTRVLAEFPSGMTLIVTSSSVNEQGLNGTVRGQYGTMYLSTNGSSLGTSPSVRSPRSLIESYTNLSPAAMPPHCTTKTGWTASTGEEPVAGIDLAMKVQAVISLAEVADRRGTMARFDPKTRKITDGSGREIKAYDYEEEAKLDNGPYGQSRKLAAKPTLHRLHGQPWAIHAGNRLIAAEAMATRFEVALHGAAEATLRAAAEGSGENHPAGRHANLYQPCEIAHINTRSAKTVPFLRKSLRYWSSASRLASKPVALSTCSRTADALLAFHE